jgi:hypothetical protein
MNYAYTGPSWAKSSFPVEVDSTNLAKEWAIPHVDLSKFASSVLDNINTIKQAKTNLPIVWVYNEPLANLNQATGLSFDKLLVDDNWKQHRNACNQYCLEQISKLDLPVLLIGGHSDIKDCNFSNIRVVCASWQKFIANKAGLNIVNDTMEGSYDSGTKFAVADCWGAEIIHRHMFENPTIDPTKTIVDSIWDTFFFWKEIERLGWFHDVHPNKRATQSFAEFLLPDVTKFLEDTK